MDLRDMKFETFTLKEMASLSTFHDQVTKIMKSRLIQSGSLKTHQEFSFSKNDCVLKVATRCPDEENVAYVLMLARPFIQKNNNTQIDLEYIISMLKNKSGNTETRVYFESIEKEYGSHWDNPQITVMAKDKEGRPKEYTSKELFDNMLYADKFHTDGDKKELIDGSMFLGPIKDAIFCDVLIDICNWAQLIDHIIADGILTKK